MPGRWGTHNEDEFDEETNEAHDDEAQRCLGRDLIELCMARQQHHEVLWPC